MQSSSGPAYEDSNTCTDTNQTTSTVTVEDYPEARNVENLCLEGRRAMLHLNYPRASQKYSEASEILAKHFGSSSPQCADALLLCGQALFASATQQNHLIQTESEMHTLDDPELEPEAENGVALLEEKSDCLEHAWHNLEIAQEIYQKTNTVDAKLKLSEVNMILGDIAFESENLGLALNHFNEALSLKKHFLKPDTRVLAETYLKVASVYEHISNLPQAIEYLEQGLAVMIRCIQSKKNELELIDRAIGKGKAKAPPEHEDPYVLIEREMLLLISSIRDVSLKIEDLQALEANGALSLELELEDSEIPPNSPVFSVSLETSDLAGDELEDPDDLEMHDHDKKRLLIEELDSPRSPKKKTRL
ncbi:hypothetical protein K493DRAFT_314738 [Basidiobolus meristosporus CBS 931.73]|uniref:Uncharacterized protein n=1 Tax=Basidiobolus meristosporus CBS 931.73 TaxID=1314790 RepID=A0A1Y1YDF1_9FUNG|nr:hypothetical protein K493DRAFT_314738 [Basidiobolus meristosporus CBS 931.73]|eukprot:ORX96017.1 hypothetical protein K493DRAFT_314738 [Basidiobolus meristosporus CBS 931.73]